MANELLTREDIIRGKENFDAFDKYLDGAASEQVTLPSGKKIKTRAGHEKKFSDAHSGTGAAYPVDAGRNSLVLYKDAGIGNTGWGAESGLSIKSGKLASLTQAGLYTFFSGASSSITDLPSDLVNVGGTVLIIPYSESSTAQILYARSSSSSPQIYMRWVSNGVADSSWVRSYHSSEKLIYETTTASSANMVITATGEQMRSTSSAIFKKDIADIHIDDYRAALKAVRPVSYRSTDATSDRTDWSWYSFIAEELGALDKRLVQMDSTEFFEDTKEDGTTFINSRELPEGEYAANGINTNGIVALMVHINQQMLVDIEKLEDEKTQLKRRMTNLEKRLDALEGPAA